MSWANEYNNLYDFFRDVMRKKQQDREKETANTPFDEQKLRQEYLKTEAMGQQVLNEKRAYLSSLFDGIRKTQAGAAPVGGLSFEQNRNIHKDANEQIEKMRSATGQLIGPNGNPLTADEETALRANLVNDLTQRYTGVTPEKTGGGDIFKFQIEKDPNGRGDNMKTPGWARDFFMNEGARSFGGWDKDGNPLNVAFGGEPSKRAELGELFLGGKWDEPHLNKIKGYEKSLEPWEQDLFRNYMKGTFPEEYKRYEALGRPSGGTKGTETAPAAIVGGNPEDRMKEVNAAMFGGEGYTGTPIASAKERQERGWTTGYKGDEEPRPFTKKYPPPPWASGESSPTGIDGGKSEQLSLGGPDLEPLNLGDVPKGGWLKRLWNNIRVRPEDRADLIRGRMNPTGSTQLIGSMFPDVSGTEDPGPQITEPPGYPIPVPKAIPKDERAEYVKNIVGRGEGVNWEKLATDLAKFWPKYSKEERAAAVKQMLASKDIEWDKVIETLRRTAKRGRGTPGLETIKDILDIFQNSLRG